MKAPRQGSIEALYSKPAYYATDRELLVAIYYQQEKIMTALSDGIALLGTNIATLQTDMAKAFSDLEAAVASGNPTDVAAAVTAIGTFNTSLQSLDASALAADATTAPPVVAPAVKPAS